MTAERFFTHPIGIVVSAAGAAFLWGSAFPAIKSAYTDLDIEPNEVFEQLLFAGYRFVLAAILILIFMKMLGKPLGYRKGTFGGIVRISLFQTLLQYIFIYIGLSLSSGIQGSIITGTTSFFQMAIAHFMYKNDSITPRKALGIALGFAGVVAVNIGRGEFVPHFGLGEWLLIAAMFFGGLGNVLSKSEAQRMELMYMTSYQMLLGGVALLAIGASQSGLMPFTITLKSVGMLVYLAFLSAAAFSLWNSVMKYNRVGKVSIYLFLMPISGVLLSAVILGEMIHIAILLALALVGAGIVIVNRDDSSKSRRRQAAAAGSESAVK